MFTKADVAEVRHVVQRILVPCVFVIGLLGNSVSIYVLTRKRMRCTTNIYLTALAITDIIYLTMALLLSLQHYDAVQRYCETYWKLYGILIWLCDACAYISIYIAVCFTIERFIAIRYPLKRQTFCTESLAKKVIAGVALFCLFSTFSTAFEHEYRIDTKLIDFYGRPCNLTRPPHVWQRTDYNTSWQHDVDSGSGSGDGPLLEPEQEVMYQAQTGVLKASKVKRLTTTADMTAQLMKATASANIPTRQFVALDGQPDRLEATDFRAAAVLSLATTVRSVNLLATEDLQQHEPIYVNCQNVTYYQNSASELARNGLYMRIWYVFSTFVFVLIPLCVLGTFNCFLIMLVRRSKNLRGEMTNASSIRRPKRKSNISSVSQENRVTVTLIAVVLLFIVCQLPWAIYLIISEQMDIDINTQAIIGNIFNLLAATNAAANFFLYCVLSDKYRKTVRELITGYRDRVHRHTHTNASLYAHSQTTVNGSRRQRNASASLVVR